MENNIINNLSGEIINAAIEVHKTLGPGLLEKCYERALAYELQSRGHEVKQQQRVPIMYKGIDLSRDDDETNALRYDLVVDDLICVELKSVESLQKIHFKQLNTYIRFLDLPLGLLFNFNVTNLMREGFGRIASKRLYEINE